MHRTLQPYPPHTRHRERLCCGQHSTIRPYQPRPSPSDGRGKLTPVAVTHLRDQLLAGQVELGDQIVLAIQRTDVVRELFSGVGKGFDNKLTVSKVSGINPVTRVKAGCAIESVFDRCH